MEEHRSQPEFLPTVPAQSCARKAVAEPRDQSPTPGRDPTRSSLHTHLRSWDQRLCVVPDGDLFKALRSGKASIETDRIDTFTETGIRLASGRELEADIIVTATGLKMEACGGMSIEVDGEPVTLGDRYVYKGMMISDVPNFAMCVATPTPRGLCEQISRRCTSADC